MRLSSLLALPAVALVMLAQTAFASNWDLDASHSEVGFREDPSGATRPTDAST